MFIWQPKVSFCVCHWSQIVRKFPFYDLWERIEFEVVAFGQMGIDQRRWRWWNAIVLIGMVSVTVTVTSSDSHEKQEQVVSRIAFGSCSNQSAPQVSKNFLFCFLLFLFLFLFCLCLCFIFTRAAVSWNWYTNHSVSLFLPRCLNSCTNMLLQSQYYVSFKRTAVFLYST